MARHRIHSLSFKKQIVQEYAAGATLNGLAREHDLSRNLIRISAAIARHESTPARPIVSRSCSAAGPSAASTRKCAGMRKDAQASPGPQAVRPTSASGAKPRVRARGFRSTILEVLSSLSGRREMPWRLRQRWSALRVRLGIVSRWHPRTSFQRQQRAAPELDNHGLLDRRQHGAAGIARPHRGIGRDGARDAPAWNARFA